MRKIIAVVLLLALIGAMGLAETVVGDPSERINAGQIEYAGKRYRPKRRLVTVLLIGTDQTSEADNDVLSYRSGGQADFLALIAIDDNQKTVTTIQINRDTMTEIQTLSEFGQEMGLWRAQICLAHSFGDGKEQSCELTADAVSRYLKDVPVDQYISMNLDGIAALNDALGGVTVTLEDDFSTYDATMLPGVTMTLQGKQAEYYTRMRYCVSDQTNASRLTRQRTYIKQAAGLFAEKSMQESGFADAVYQELKPYIITDMSQGKMINLANRLAEYTIMEIVEIEGTSRLGDREYIEFIPDENSLWQVVLSAFYDEIVE